MKTNLIRQHCLLIPIISVLLSSCMETGDTEFEEQVKFDDQLITQHFETNDITAVKDNPSGMYYEVLKENSGGTPIEQDDIVSIRYVMKTLGGKLIDSLNVTEQADTTVRFQHTTGAIYPEGINWGVRLMNEGEKFRFYVPSYRAFGNYSYKTLLPSDAILIVETEVVKVESKENIKSQDEQSIEAYIASHQLENVSKKSSGIFYQQLSEGSGQVITAGQAVKVAYKGLFLNDEVFDESESNAPLSFTIGYSNIIKGFEEGIKLMKKGEKGRIFIPSDLAYAQGTQVIPGVIRKDFLKTYNLRDMPPFQTLIFEVEIKEVN